jgi:hypothetical protein
MNVICLMLSWSALAHPLCHVERSETSLDVTYVTWHTAAANNLRFFASLRMTATRGFRQANP